MFNVIIIFSFDIFLQLGCSGVVVVEGNTNPRELYPYPSLVVIERGFDLSQPVVLFYFLE